MSSIVCNFLKKQPRLGQEQNKLPHWWAWAPTWKKSSAHDRRSIKLWHRGGRRGCMMTSCSHCPRPRSTSPLGRTHALHEPTPAVGGSPMCLGAQGPRSAPTLPGSKRSASFHPPCLMRSCHQVLTQPWPWKRAAPLVCLQTLYKSHLHSPGFACCKKPESHTCVGVRQLFPGGWFTSAGWGQFQRSWKTRNTTAPQGTPAAMAATMVGEELPSKMAHAHGPCARSSCPNFKRKKNFC